MNHPTSTTMNHQRMGVRSPWMAAGRSMLRLRALCCAARLGARCCYAPPPSSSRLLLCLVRRTRTLATPSAVSPQKVSALLPPTTTPRRPCLSRGA